MDIEDPKVNIGSYCLYHWILLDFIICTKFFHMHQMKVHNGVESGLEWVLSGGNSRYLSRTTWFYVGE